MTVYYVIYFLLLSATLGDLFIKREAKKSTLIPICAIALITIFTAGLRWETGTDWGNYLYYFRMIERVPIWQSQMEIGYEFIVRFFKFVFGSNYTLFLFFFATLSTSFNSYTLYKVSPYPLFSLFLFMSYSVAGSLFGVRQDLSICLVLFSIQFIERRSFYHFALTIFIASLIHNSAIIFFPAYYIYRLKWNAVTIAFILMFLITSFYLSGYLIQIFGPMISERKTELYLELGQENLEDPYTALIKGLSSRLLFLAVLIPLVNYSDQGNRNFNGLFNLYVFGIIIYASFTPISPVFSRLARPYDIFQILVIPFAYNMTNRFYKLLIIFIILSFSIFKFTSTIKNDPGVLVPYKSIFTENSDQ